MVRIITVQSARASKKSRACRRCRVEIQVGDTYKHFSKRYGGTSYYCSEHYPRASEMTSGKTADGLSLTEDMEDLVAGETVTIDSLEDDLESIKGGFEELAESYHEAASNIEDGFGHATERSEEMESQGDELDEYVSAIDTLISEIADVAEDEDLADADRQEAVQQLVGDTVGAYPL